MTAPQADTHTTPLPATVEMPPPRPARGRHALAISLAQSDGALPHLTGEIRDLIYVRLREVALLVTGGWAFILLLCLSGLDGLFNRDRLGTGCVAAVGATVTAFALCWAALLRGPRYPVRWLRAFEAVYMWGSVACAAWLRYAAVGSALDQTPPDRFMVLYAGALSGLVWMTVFVIYGIFAPNTWRRLVWTIAAALVVLLGVDLAVWAGRAADPSLFVSYLLVTGMAVFLGAGIAVYGSFKLGTAREEAAVARRQLRDLGRYRLTKLLGAGAMGEVYLAEHTLLRRPCAVKLIRPDPTGGEKQAARFEREVQATAALTHPNTVEIYDYGRAEDGTFYYAMEYLPGWPLDRLVARHGPVPPARAVHLLRQVCGALREAHAAGLVHRDVKPANVMVCTRGGVPDVVKLLDFGLVRAADPGSGRLTVDGSVAGTPDYMSPEQAEGGAELDGRSDLYNLGGVAYFLLTGRPPFQKATALQLLFAHARDPADPPSAVRPGVPADLDRVVLRCLEKDRERRYRDAAELDAALAACTAAGAWTAAEAAEWWHRHGTVEGDVSGAGHSTAG
jgi:eukaryotic-like serine/threonine-protein kinase